MAQWNWKTCLFGAVSGFAGVKIWQRIREESLCGQTVLITGGSRGLGLLMAREFARQGSRVAICARDEEELRAAEQDLADRGATVFAARCDVANRDQVEEFAATAAECLGPIDVLVNNAGIIQIGPLDAMSLEDFEQTIDVMYWGVLHPTLAVLPHMRKRGRGRIVNIASIGGLVSLPHLTPYGCAKSAAIALSEGLHAELAGTGIHVTTVVPGIMRIGSHLNACFAEQAEKEYRWFSLGASLPLMSVSGERAARIIVSATKRRKAFQFIGLPAAVLARLHGLFPGTTARVLGLTNRWLLPDGAGSETSTQLRGKDARDKLDSRIVNTMTALGDSAAERTHQHRGKAE